MLIKSIMIIILTILLEFDFFTVLFQDYSRHFYVEVSTGVETDSRIIRPYFERYRLMNRHLHLCTVTVTGIMSGR